MVFAQVMDRAYVDFECLGRLFNDRINFVIRSKKI
jgi:hypothetical protein